MEVQNPAATQRPRSLTHHNVPYYVESDCFVNRFEAPLRKKSPEFLEIWPKTPPRRVDKEVGSECAPPVKFVSALAHFPPVWFATATTADLAINGTP